MRISRGDRDESRNPGSRISRRGLLGLAVLGGAALGGGAVVHRPRAATPAIAGPTPVAVRAYPLASFDPGEPGRRAFGALTFRGGLELQSPFAGFGGFSGLWRSPDGGRLVAVSDNAHWLTARIATEEGRLAGLFEAVMAPLLGEDGAPLRDGPSYDTESLAIAGDAAYVGVERTQEILRFPFARDGVLARAERLAVPEGLRDWPRNKGPEALAVAPPASPAAGALVAIAERARWEESAPTQGFILGGSRPGPFDLARSDGFEPTDLAFLEGGDLLVLERRFSVLGGVAVRLRRIGGGALAPGATLDGPVVFASDGSRHIDNLEGLALHRGAAGETVVTLIADNNFSLLQRTLLLEFALSGE